MTRIQTTHVGSLPRLQAVVDFLFARERGEAHDRDGLRCLHARRGIGDRAQAGSMRASTSCRTGETSKISYATYVSDRYTGFAGDSPRQAPADLRKFPGFMERLARAGGTPSYARPECVGEVRVKDHVELDKDIANLRAAMAAHDARRGFMNAASPGVIALFQPNRFYPDRHTYIDALADAMKEEYERIAASGLDLQIDCPDLALARHMQFADLTEDEFVAIAARNVEALNHALRDIDPARVRVHICWGNYEGPHVCDIGMDKVFSLVMSIRSRYVLFEAANPRHGHEWTVFRDRKSEIPEDKILVPGVVDTTTNFVEHPELVAHRIGTFASIVGVGSGDRRLRLRFRHLRGVRRGGPGHRLRKAPYPGRGSGDCERSFELASLGDTASISVPTAIDHPL